MGGGKESCLECEGVRCRGEGREGREGRNGKRGRREGGGREASYEITQLGLQPSASICTHVLHFVRH